MPFRLQTPESNIALFKQQTLPSLRQLLHDAGAQDVQHARLRGSNLTCRHRRDRMLSCCLFGEHVQSSLAIRQYRICLFR